MAWITPGTPLAKKLGIKPGTVPPGDHRARRLSGSAVPLPRAYARPKRRERPRRVHLFSKTRPELGQKDGSLRYKTREIKQNGAILGVVAEEDVGNPVGGHDDTVRVKIVLPQGLVDIKVCAVDATWSGLKLVIRKQKPKMTLRRADPGRP